VIENVDQAKAWNGVEGEAWAANQDRFDDAVRGYEARLLEAAAVSQSARVLDIGCGCGQSTRDAGRTASSGHALGVDLSIPMLERARELARAEGLTNVTFEQADAQVHPFGSDAFDLAISRFGVMFFDDPVAAFANIGRSLGPGARIALLAWQPLECNEWLGELRTALAMGRTLPAPPVGAPGPFGLADPDAVRRILGEAGYRDVDVVGVSESFHAGADAEDAYDFVSRIPLVRGMLQDLDDATARRALDRLRATLAAHDTPAGVHFGSCAWLVTAARGRPPAWPRPRVPR
jgi:SAM-dependent methyltransferase